jgi:hypothetical protein
MFIKGSSFQKWRVGTVYGGTTVFYYHLMQRMKEREGKDKGKERDKNIIKKKVEGRES